MKHQETSIRCGLSGSAGRRIANVRKHPPKIRMAFCFVSPEMKQSVTGREHAAPFIPRQIRNNSSNSRGCKKENDTIRTPAARYPTYNSQTRRGFPPGRERCQVLDLLLIMHYSRALK